MFEYGLPSDLKMTVNLLNFFKYPHIINSSMAGFYNTTIFFKSSHYNSKYFGQEAGQLF